MRTTWPIVLVLVAFTLGINGISIDTLLRKPRGLPSGRVRVIWTIFLVYSLAHLTRSFVEHSITPDFSDTPWIALDTFIKNSAFLIIVASLFVYSRTLGTLDAFAALVIGIGFGAGINIALDTLGIFGSADAFGESRFEGLQARWRPPLSRSNAFYGMTCTVAFGLTIHIVLSGFRSFVKNPVILIAVSLCGFLSAWAAVKCQFRAHLLAVATALLLLSVRSTVLLRLGGLSVVSAVAIFPLLFASDLGYVVLDAVAPEQLLLKIGSSREGSDSLSDRVFLYQFGWDNLSQPLVFALGEGPVLRDAQGAIGDLPIISYKMPYHSGFLDFVMQFGLPIATLLIASIGLLVFTGCAALTTTLDADARLAIRLGIVNLMLWLSLSILDSGLSNLETLCLAVTPLLGKLISSRAEQAKTIGR